MEEWGEGHTGSGRWGTVYWAFVLHPTACGEQA